LKIFTLSPPLSSDAIHAFRSDVKEELARGGREVALDIDALGDLETPVLSLLITLLRDARQCGARIVLRAREPRVMQALRLTGLDKIFPIEPPRAPEVSEPHLERRSGLRRRFVAALALGFLGVLVSQASAASEASPQDVVAKIIAQNADMRSYQAQVSVDVRLRSFPYAVQHLDGTTYFKRPDSYEVVFDSVPQYAKGFDKLYSDIGDPTSWGRHFDLSLIGWKSEAGHRDIVLRLVQKVRGMIDHEDVAIDPVAWRIDEMEWHYYNGGAIAMSQEYQNVGGFTVLAKQHATIHIPFVHAAADATYGDYHTNVAIDDSVFTREKH
jgi:anti-anti-sigma factor